MTRPYTRKPNRDLAYAPQGEKAETAPVYVEAESKPDEQEASDHFPIETAPKDRIIQLLAPTGVWVRAIWSETREFKANERRWLKVTKWVNPITRRGMGLQNPQGWKEMPE